MSIYLSMMIGTKQFKIKSELILANRYLELCVGGGFVYFVYKSYILHISNLNIYIFFTIYLIFSHCIDELFYDKNDSELFRFIIVLGLFIFFIPSKSYFKIYFFS